MPDSTLQATESLGVPHLVDELHSEEEEDDEGDKAEKVKETETNNNKRKAVKQLRKRKGK